MIKVNLARGFQAAGSRTTVGIELEAGASDIQRQGATKLLIIMIFPLVLYAYEFVSIPDMKAKLNQRRGYLSELTTKNSNAKQAVEEIRKFKEDQDKLQDKISSIEVLRKDRMLEVKLLDAIQASMPEKVWLLRLDLVEKKLTLGGLAISDSDISSFMESLNRIPVLSEVNLIRSTESSSPSGNLKRFELGCVVNRD